MQPIADDFGERVAKAQTLIDAGALEAAAELCAGLCDDFPDRPAGFSLRAHCASLASDWPGAQTLWETCLDRFPQAPPMGWLLAKGWALFHQGHAEAAEVDFLAAQAVAPDHSGPAVALATCATKREDWALAVPRWEDCLARFPDLAHEGWLVSRAQGLLGLGQKDAATQAFRHVLQLHPENRFAQWNLVQLLAQRDRKGEALYEMESGVLKNLRTPELLHDKLRLLVWRTDAPAARACFAEAFGAVARLEELTDLFNLVPACFEGWPRTRTWLDIRQRLAELAGAAPDDPRAVVLALRLDVALRDYDGFLARQASAPELPEPWGERFARLARTLRAPRFPDFLAPKVFGIGLSRTGTTSLTSALEILGYTTAHFLNGITRNTLCDEDFFIFDALTDTPVCLQIENLYHMFPNARFIYTVRAHDEWLASYTRHCIDWDSTADVTVLRQRTTTRGEFRYGTDFARIGWGLYYHHPSPSAAYAAHDARVRHFFSDKPPGRLLEFDVFSGHGWPELCGFLGCPVPDTAYPWENQGK